MPTRRPTLDEVLNAHKTWSEQDPDGNTVYGVKSGAVRSRTKYYLTHAEATVAGRKAALLSLKRYGYNLHG